MMVEGREAVDTLVRAISEGLTSRRSQVEELTKGSHGQGGWQSEEAQRERQAMGVPFLRLLRSLEGLEALKTPLGLTADGRPVVLNLKNSSTAHFALLDAPTWLQGEVFRTVVLGLALTCRPSEAQVVGIDLTGVELPVLESLPHALTDLATERTFSSQVLDWLVEEAERRRLTGVRRPAIIVAAVTRDRPESRGLLADQLAGLLKTGAAVGIHVLVGSQQRSFRGISVSGVVAARPAGQERDVEGLIPLRLEIGNRETNLRAITLSVRELDVAVALASAGWRVARPGLEA